MTRRIFALSSILTSWISTRPLSACGDKNSNAARGLWRGQGVIGKRERILLVGGPEVRTALPHMSVVAADLRDAGYEPTWVGTSEFAAELKVGEWNLIVAGGIEADQAAEAKGPDRILLIAMNASKEQKKAARKRYSGVITGVATNSIVVDVADALEVVSLRAAKQRRSITAAAIINGK